MFSIAIVDGNAPQTERPALDRLLEELVERSYALSLLNDLMEGMNQCDSLEALVDHALPLLLTMTGASGSQLRMEAARIPEDCQAPKEALALIATLKDGTRLTKRAFTETIGDTYVALYPLVASGAWQGELLLWGEANLLPELGHGAVLLQALCGQLALGVAGLRYVEEVKRLSTLDGLTGLLNHACFQDRLRGEFERARRYQQVFSLVMLDVDHFKRINDTHGHPVGDQVLMALGGLLKCMKRESDVAARYGGEEFILILPGTPKESALLLVERVREAARKIQIHRADGVLIKPVTASFGIAAYHPAEASPHSLLERADRALYQAKHAGRDQACLAEDPPPSVSRPDEAQQMVPLALSSD